MHFVGPKDAKKQKLANDIVSSTTTASATRLMRNLSTVPTSRG